MSAPSLTLVPAAAPEPVSNAERLMAQGQMIVALDAFEQAAEALHSAAYWFEKAARAGGGYGSQTERIGRARDLLRETNRRVDAGVDHLIAHERGGR